MNEEIEKEAEIFTYADIISTLISNDELIITIPVEEVEKVKIGLKNFKAKQILRLKEEGLPIPDETLSFYSTLSDCPDHIDLRIVLNRKGTVRIKKIVIPDSKL